MMRLFSIRWSIVLLAIAAVTFWSSVSLAQTEWEKSTGNPALDIGPSGSWDDDSISHANVLFDGSEYKMWYAGEDGQNMRIGLATSPDGIVWNKYYGNPVLDLGLSGSWDDTKVLAPSVLYDGSEYTMWYEAYDGSTYRIGYATSEDGVVWTTYAGNPILDVGAAGEWDDRYVFGPSVLFDGGGYHMWYTGSDGSHERIGYAASPDGVAWTKHAGNPVLDVGPSDTWDDRYVKHCYVQLTDGEYSMWYTGYDGHHERTGQAASEDGIVWTKYPGNPVLDLGPSDSWEYRHASHPSVLSSGLGYKMWYNGGESSRRRIGYAVSMPESCDIDIDGSFDEACGGWDCDDSDPEINPGAVEDCDDGIDQDCDGLIDDLDPDCIPEFILEMDASYASGTLSLDFTLGTEYESVWANYLVLTSPSIQLIHLWTILLPVVVPPVDIPVSFPFSSDGWMGIYSAIYVEGVREVFALEWVATGS